MKTSKSSLFLMELIIAILFFALASAVCIQLFVKSHLLGNTTAEENHALLLCQNLSEIYLGILPEHYQDSPEAMEEYIFSLTEADEAFQNPIKLQVTSENGAVKLLMPDGGANIDLSNLLPEAFCSEMQSESYSPDSSFAFLLCYDGSWENCTYESSVYRVLFFHEGYSDDSDVYTAAVFACKEPPAPERSWLEIYHLNVCKHIPERM